MCVSLCVRIGDETGENDETQSRNGFGLFFCTLVLWHELILKFLCSAVKLKTIFILNILQNISRTSLNEPKSEVGNNKIFCYTTIQNKGNGIDWIIWYNRSQKNLL